MKKLGLLNNGDLLQEITLPPVSRIDLIKYAGASGDFNPIHLVDEEAEKAGLSGIIAHGMWTMGNLAKLFTPYFNEGFIQEYKVRFEGMVFLNDIIRIRAIVEDATDNIINFNVSAINQHQKTVMQGSVAFFIF